MKLPGVSSMGALQAWAGQLGLASYARRVRRILLRARQDLDFKKRLDSLESEVTESGLYIELIGRRKPSQEGEG